MCNSQAAALLEMEEEDVWKENEAEHDLHIESFTY
jgi:hypothetical protein